MTAKILSFLVFLSLDIYGYKYICNGFLANGSEREDECGVCDQETAARWVNPNVAILVDYSVTPPGISVEEWQKIVQDSILAWNEIPGASFRFFEIDGKNPREFGKNQQVHEVYWVTEPDEWHKYVDPSDHGTLAATLPRYTCVNNKHSHRVIFDGDIILNGLDYISWKSDCPFYEDCVSPTATLTHELGHLVGLDHPDVFSETSIMSAVSGNELLKPTFDDIDGVMSLYPLSLADGTFGFPCEQDYDCRYDFQCVQEGEGRICSHVCNYDSDCEEGAFCLEEEGAPSYCHYPRPETILQDPMPDEKAAVGESCLENSCEEGLICAGFSHEKAYCYETCSFLETCSRGYQCVDVNNGESACVKENHENQECGAASICAAGLVCQKSSSGEKKCQRTCLTDSDCESLEYCHKEQNEGNTCKVGIRTQGITDAFKSRFGQVNGKVQTPFFTVDFANCSQNSMASLWMVWFMLLLLGVRKKYDQRK